jgi:hypothetical protein
MSVSAQVLTSTKYGFKICTAPMTFNSILSRALKTGSREEQMSKI